MSVCRDESGASETIGRKLHVSPRRGRSPFHVTWSGLLMRIPSDYLE